jgi:hypothetical protein
LPDLTLAVIAAQAATDFFRHGGMAAPTRGVTKFLLEADMTSHRNNPAENPAAGNHLRNIFAISRVTSYAELD